MIIRILASSLNWKVNGPRLDPAGGAADAVADGEGQDQQPELQAVDRPGQRLEPAVVERGRDHEHDDRDARPHQPAREGRPAVER